MNACRVLALTVAAALAWLVPVQPGVAQDAPTDPLYASFERIVSDLNNNELNSFVRAVDEDRMLEAIYDKRLIDTELRQQFGSTFATEIERIFVGSFRASEGEIIGRIVSFQRDGDRAKAVVRFDLSPYQYLYHEFHLRAGRRDKAVIEDWIDFFRGEQLTQAVGASLVMAKPGSNQTRSLLSPLQLTEAETFQAAELFKAIRDRKFDRYFEILPGLDKRIQQQELVAVTSVHAAQQARNRQQYRAALTNLAANYAANPRYTTMLLDYYLPKREYQPALEALLRLKDRLGTDDAAINSQLATIELILGNKDAAKRHAEAAVASEPKLELAWWAALRARTAAAEYDQAIEALEVLETEFGHQLRGDVLKKDSGLAELLDTEEFKSWRGNASEGAEG